MLLVDPTPHSIYPGQTISISVVVVGQDWGTVAGSVYAQFLQSSILKYKAEFYTSQGVQSVTQKRCNVLNYTVFSEDGDEVDQTLVFTAHNYIVPNFYIENNYDLELDWDETYKITDETINKLHYSDNPVYVNISFSPCPSGFMLTKIKPFRCDCNKLLQQIPGVQCFIEEHIIGRSGLVWVGMIDDDNGTNGTVAASQYCPLNYCSKTANNVTLSEPDSQCNYNHSGTLCGGCQPGLSLTLGSAQCLPCSNDYLGLFVPFSIVGPAIIVGVIKLLDLTIPQGTLDGLVFY